MRSVRVLAPATTANLGPGFDALGLALDLSNELEVELLDSPGLAIEVEGEGQELPRDEHHLVVRILRELGRETGLRVRQVNRIPLARGLGSSAATMAAAATAARHLFELDLDPLQDAARREGHPDNVAPCVLGGLIASAMEGERTFTVPLEIHPCWKVALAIPDYELSTEEARRLLPADVSLAAATFNLGRLGLLIGALARGDGSLLREATRDRLHQPFRARLIKGFEEACSAALETGASGAFISGAGPTVAALVDTRTHDASAVAEAMAAALGGARPLALAVDTRGCRLA